MAKQRFVFHGGIVFCISWKNQNRKSKESLGIQTADGIVSNKQAHIKGFRACLCIGERRTVSGIVGRHQTTHM